MDFTKWNNPNQMPDVGEYFVAKVKNEQNKFILGQIIAASGWLACPYSDKHYWSEFKHLIEHWYYVKDIGQ
jgi:hypothetical protein